MDNFMFRKYVTSMAFRIDLSRDMILTLVETSRRDDDGNLPGYHFAGIHRMFGFADASYTSSQALVRRGLLYAPDPTRPGIHHLTRAGELTLGLLEEAGLIEQFDDAVKAVEDSAA